MVFEHKQMREKKSIRTFKFKDDNTEKGKQATLGYELYYMGNDLNEAL